MTGLSMGGFATWELAAFTPKRFAAIAPICGGTPKLTIYPEAEHDSWTETYNNPEFYEWLLAQKRADIRE